MNKIHKQRILTLSFFISMLILAAALMLYSLRQNLNVFFTPTQLKLHPPKTSYTVRLGGLVKKDSVQHDEKSLLVRFLVTDLKNEIAVTYPGILPDLFRPGKGVIVEGQLTHSGELNASIVLAKHDENYLPKKVYQTLRNQ